MATQKKKPSKRPRTIATGAKRAIGEARGEGLFEGIEQTAAMAGLAGLIQGFAFKLASGADEKKTKASPPSERVLMLTCNGPHPGCGERMVPESWSCCPFCGRPLHGGRSQ